MPEPTPRTRKPRSATARPAASRRIGSLRRSQARLAGDEIDSESSEGDGTTTDENQPRTPSVGAAPATGGQRVRRSLLHPGRGQIIAAVIMFVVGLGGVMQIRINASDDTYTTARREDLIQLLDGLGAESRRLESEISELEQTRTSLRSGADTQRVAREEAQKRVEELSILAGTAPAVGPGIRMRIADPEGKVDAAVLLDAVEEMRDAGAEVIEVNDTIRIVGSSWFGADSHGLLIDGTPVSRPVTFEVIGDPHSLEEAARFRGGIVSEITGAKIGGQVQIDQDTRIVVESLHPAAANQYAQPASPAPTPR
jgi:uncharacterized protein YlxW (UPF0749 family)